MSSEIAASLVALGATVIGGGIAVGWPTWRAWQIQRRFVKLIRRELEEIGPDISETWADAIIAGGADVAKASRPWWEYQTRRFVHEEFLTYDRITEHRDFVLSLDPTLVYFVSQLWISRTKRDGTQWAHYLGKLAECDATNSDGLERAATLWRHIVDTSPVKSDASVRRSTGRTMTEAVERVDGLFEARLAAYNTLMPCLSSAAMSTREKQAALVDAQTGPMRTWLREHGLLMSGDALYRYMRLRRLLEGDEISDMTGDREKDLENARSALRTELKIDLGVRHPDERDEPLDRTRRRA
jgi:hypothetical protein